MTRRANAPVAPTRSYKLRVDTLEDRVVMNAVDPLAAVAFVGPVQTDDVIAEQTADSVDHVPGCTCGNCQAIVTPGMGPAQELAYAMPVPPDRPSAIAPPAEAPPFPYAQTFNLHSRQGATKVVYLDFNGHTTTGTQWNTSFGTVVTPAFNFEGSASTFSNLERERIQFIWQRISEDFSPFDVDITTEDPGLEALRKSGAGDTQWGVRVAIGGRWQDWLGSSAGGVAYLNSFDDPIDTPTYVFADTMGNDEKYIVDAGSHEIGHTLGLNHDATVADPSYYGGHQAGSTPGWAPIMGVGYSYPVTQWSKGEYPGANNTEDDLAIIASTANGFGYRVDDAGNTIATATPAVVNETALSFSGVIEKTTDVDVLKFASGAGNVSFTFKPYLRGTVIADANLDIFAELLDANGTVLTSHNPANQQNAAITNFDIPAPGFYYLRISGVGAGNLTSGYSDYGSLGQYTVAGTIVLSTSLSGLESPPLTFTENGPALSLTAAINIAGPVDIKSATVAISPVGTGDTLLFTNTPEITGVYDANTGVLTLTGPATLAAYRAALRSVQYANLSNNPTPGARSIAFQVTDATDVESNTVSRSLNVIATNDDPLLDPVGPVTINEGVGLQTIDLTGILAGGGESQTLQVSASSDNTSLIPDPAVVYASPADTGSITFTPVADAFGSAKITVTVSDGTASVSREFVVTVNPVNDAPSATIGADIYAQKQVIAPATEVEVAGFATGFVAGPANESGQVASYVVTIDSSDNAGLFSVAPAISPAGKLTFTPAIDQVGTAVVRVVVMDDGGTANFGVNAGTPQTFVLNVGINRAPILDNSGVAVLNPVAKGSVAPVPTAVGAFATASFRDDDLGTVAGGIALVAADSTEGIWEFSTDAGATWVTVPNPVPAGSGILLRPTDLVKFTPTDPDFIGFAALTFRSWDQFTGAAGATVSVAGAGVGQSPFSAATETATVRVAPLFIRSLEDAKTVGNRLTTLQGVTFADADAGAKKGLAIIGSGGLLAGRWEYSLTNGRSWKAFGPVDAAHATLLRNTDKVRFVPAANASGEAFLLYRAWDQTVGKAGATADVSAVGATGGNTAFSVATDVLFTRVTAVNDRPVLDVLGPTVLTPIDASQLVDPLDSPGDLVSSILASTATDADGDVPGLAVTAASKIGGNWQYKVGVAAWVDIPANVSPTKAVVLSPNDRLRFAPAPGVTFGSATVSYKAWDGTTTEDPLILADTTKSTAFSAIVETAKVNIEDFTPMFPYVPNVAPILLGDNTPALPDPPLTPALIPVVVEDDKKPAGYGVGLDLLPFGIFDEGISFGVAVVGVTGAASGAWQYSTTNGKSWKPFGVVSDAHALLLREADKIRFLPAANFTGDVSVTYRAWDQTRGSVGQYANLALPGTTGGTNSIGVETGTATVHVEAVNDKPVLDTKPAPALTPVAPGTVNPAGDAVASLLGTALTDVDAGALEGIAITKAGTANGQWQYQLFGDTQWRPVGFVNAANAVHLRDIDKVRFVPGANFSGTESLGYRGWDRTSSIAPGANSLTGGANATALSLKTESASIIVNAANDRPVLDTAPDVRLPSQFINQTDTLGNLVSALIGASVTDPDANDPKGIAVVGTDNRNGLWEFQVNGGAWFAYGTVSTTSAVVLKAGDRVRFTPKLGFAGSTTLKFKAWDGTDNQTGGDVVNTNVNSAFSLKTETATLAVNSAPTLVFP